MLNASCQCTKPWNSQAHAVASNSVGDLLFRLFLVETSCLGQIQHLFNLSFFTIIVAVFSFFFCSFYSYKTFLEEFQYSRIIHTLHKDLACRQDRGGHCSLQEITPFSWFFRFVLLEAQVWKYFKIRLVTSEKYKPSFFS